MGGWMSGGSVDGEDATTKESGNRVEALWGGSDGNTPGDNHGHIVSNDGVNADYVREPGGDVTVDSSKSDPYEGYHSPGH